MSEFLAMGGYGGFIWPAFGVTALVMTALLISSRRGLRRNERIMEAMEARNPGRRARQRQADSIGDTKT